MAAIEVVDAIPLAVDQSGVYRIGATRVSLDLVVRAFDRGATAEEIVQDYPSLALSEVYQVIDYYLKHGSTLQSYLSRREREESDLKRQHEDKWSPPGLRDRLLARRKGQ